MSCTANRLKELAVLNLKLGTFAFGGPAAHIAMMEDEVVRRRNWLTHEQFLDMLGASNLIPGPSSTELAIHIGYRLAGGLGLLVAGCCFILPAALLVTAIAWGYTKFGHVPAIRGVLYGVKPVAIAIVLQAVWRLGRMAVKTKFLAAMGLIAVAMSIMRLSPLAILFGVGGIVAAMRLAVERHREKRTLPLLALGLPTASTTAPIAMASAGLWPLFFVFLKIGCIVFGSGYVLLAFLRADMVERLHWLTEGQLIDSVAVGQVTPGPVFTTATFIGYLLAGPKGAVIATVGIFLPAFVLVAISAPFLPKLRRSKTAGAFLDGLNIASLALMAVVTWQLGRSALVDVNTVIVAAATAFLLLVFRLNSTWLVLSGALVGMILTWWHG
jgi:chromate transporter